MEKFIKGFIIYGLLAIVICALLIIVFYEYRPQIELSEVKKYDRQEQTSNIIQEINTSEIGDSSNKDIIKSYEISAYDLEAYKILDIYQESKPDPFSDVLRNAKYDESMTKSASQIIKENGGTNKKDPNSTGYFQSSSKTK